MSVLTALGAIDIRAQLPRRDWIIGMRPSTTSLTWHYNGPAVAREHQHGEGLIAQLIADSNWQMRKGWGGTKDGAPHLMYHLVVAANGQIYQTADLLETLWHCAHADGNGRGLALHFPLGGDQEPTPMQLASAFRASDLLRAQFQIPLNRVFGHLEWKHATACPGTHIMAHLSAYRAHCAPTVTPTPTPAGLRRWQVNPLYTDPVRVHQAPSLASPVAMRLKPGTIVFVDVVKPSDTSDPTHPRWIHMARVPNEQADAGFIAEDCGVWL
jgi:hypothetical protein